MLSCKNISKHFLLGNSLKSVEVLKDVSLNIDAGQITALKGPSGSGKSTLLNLISGLEEPSYGEIYLNKTCLNKLSINELSSFRNNNIGIIFQFFNLINGLWMFFLKYIMQNTKYPKATGGTPIISWLPNQIKAVMKEMRHIIKIIGLSLIHI